MQEGSRLKLQKAMSLHKEPLGLAGARLALPPGLANIQLGANAEVAE